MPIYQGTDNKGSYYQWGSEGKKYYFNQYNFRSMKIAHNKAIKQGMANILMAKKKLNLT